MESGQEWGPELIFKLSFEGREVRVNPEGMKTKMTNLIKLIYFSVIWTTYAIVKNF